MPLCPPLGSLKEINVNFVDKKALILNTKQKVVLAFLGAFIFMMLAPSLLPETWFIAVFINKLGMAGCLIFLVVLMTLVHFDDRPLLDFREMSAKGFNWDIYMTMCFVVPFAGLFTSDATGIKPFILEVLQPILSTLSPLVFVIVTMFIATILTNFANNMIIIILVMPFMFNFASSIGLAPTGMIVLLFIMAQFALATPAASPVTAVAMGQDMADANEMTKAAIKIVPLMFIIGLCLGWPFVSLIF